MKHYKLVNEPLLKIHTFCSRLRFKRQKKIHFQDSTSLYMRLKGSLPKAVYLDSEEKKLRFSIKM